MAEQRPEIANTIQTGSFKTNYHDLGKGFPVTLLHGSGPGVTAWANWNKLFPLLKDDFRVIAPDLSGFGFTERVSGRVETMNGWVEQTIDLLDALKIEKTNLVGNSFGGALALSLAIKHPQRVNKLVLMGAMGVSFPITYGLDQVWGYEPSVEHMEELLEIFTYNHGFATKDLIKTRYESSIQPGFQESFHALFPEPRQKGVEAMAGNQQYIRNIPHETLIVHGREDRVIPLDNSYRLLQLIDNAQLHVFGKCGHWTQIEHTQEFADLIRPFFKRVAMDAGKIIAYAAQLFDAERNRKAIPPLTNQDPSISVDDAYHIQLENVKKVLALGHTISGKKIGLTSEGIQKQFGVNEPDYGHLYAAMDCKEGKVNTSALLQPKIEGEIAFVLKADLAGGKVTREDVLKATDYVVASFEIVDSRIADWKIKLPDTIADNASSGRYILGNRKLKLSEVDLPKVSMKLYKNQDELVGEGTGAAVLGDPCISVAWLANRLWTYGVTLKAGEVILSGAFSAAPLAAKGDIFRAEFSTLGKVEAQFV